MAYPRTAGMPDFTSTGSHFIPEIWSPRIQLKFYAKTVAMDICNTWYEGEIKEQGDTVHIRAYPDVIVSDHKNGEELSVQIPTSSSIALNIDKGKSFCIALSSIDKAQSDLKLMDMYSKSAGEDMAVKIDQDVLQNTYGDADSSNVGATAGIKSGGYNLGASGSPLSITSANIYDVIVDVNTVLDEQNIPDEERYIVLPPVFCNSISKSDLKDASMTGDRESIMRNGNIGKIDNMTIYKSNNLYSVTDGTTSNECWYCLAGHISAISFASQLSILKTAEIEKGFGELLKGLEVYGYKVITPKALSYIYAQKGTV